MKDEEKLKPLLCPFCGSYEIDEHLVSVDKSYCQTPREKRMVCRNCDAVGPMPCRITWNTRPAEKLVPLDKVKIYHLIKKYFLMIPGDDRPTNIIHDNELDNACDEICARFGSVPVVPEEFKELFEDSECYCLDSNESFGRNPCAWCKCKAAFNEAVKEGKGFVEVNKTLVEALEKIARLSPADFTTRQYFVAEIREIAKQALEDAKEYKNGESYDK